jgi:hypothetical protein
MNTLPIRRLSQYAVEQVHVHAERIRPLVRMQSLTLTTACRQVGLPLELAELCGGLLASVVDDLIMASRLSKADFERSKRMERILAATEEPAVSALRIAMAASPVNGRACARHWDVVCDKGERGKLAWLLGMDMDTAWKYGQKIFRRNAK